MLSGMRFWIFVHSEQVTTHFKRGIRHTDPRLPGYLPLRPVNHTYTPYDFAAYEEMRDNLLRRDPRIGRAALLSGGLLWRLAIEYLAPDIVLDGPGELAYAYGIGFTFCDRDGAVYVEDGLTDSEIRCIIGTYVREPTERNNVRGYAYPSWWPDPIRFEESSLDFGWWSPIAERWYRKMRAEYRTGSKPPRTASEWRASIRNRDKRARRFTEMNRDAAAEFLRLQSSYVCVLFPANQYH